MRPENKGEFYLFTMLLPVVVLTGAMFAAWTDVTVMGIIPMWQVILGLTVVWIAASITMLQVDEIGVVLFYGTPMITVGRGPKLLLLGIFQLEKFQCSVIQNQFPDEPELIQKTDDKTPLESVQVVLSDGSTVVRQKVRPMRITTRGPDSKVKDDILNTQMTVEFTFWVRWIIVKPFELIIGTGGNTQEAVRQMRDAGESVLNLEVSKRTPSQLISDFDTLQKQLQVGISKSVESWGIDIISVGLTTPDLNHEVAKAMRDVTVAKAHAVKTRTTAEAESYRLQKEGEGRGKARASELAGEGRGYKEGAKLMGVKPEEFLAAQVARDTVGEGDLILGTDGIAQAIGIGKTIMNSSKSGGK